MLVILLAAAAYATGRRTGNWTPPGYDTASVINLDNTRHIIKGRVESCRYDPASNQYLLILSNSDDEIEVGVIVLQRPDVEVGARITVFARFFVFAEIPIFYCESWEVDEGNEIGCQDRVSSVADT